MHRILFAKIEAWIVVLAGLLVVLGVIGFGAAVLDTERGDKRLGVFGQVALDVAEIPFTVERILDANKKMMAFNPDRFSELPRGWMVDPVRAGEMTGYILLSRYGGNVGQHRVELVSLPDMKTVHEWEPNADELLADAARTSKLADYSLWNTSSWRAIHPYLMDNGDLIVKDHQSPLFRIDACAKPVWMLDSMMFHHSTEADGDGGFWIPGLIEPQTLTRAAEDLYEDALVHVSADGKIIESFSVLQALIDAGLEYELFAAGRFQNDPAHLNDIQPVLADGAYWKKGDLFLSLRHLSAIVQFRPSTGKIVWMKQGPWMAQHDVDLVGPTSIAVYNNAAYDRGGGARVSGNNNVLYYDFATDTISDPFEDAMLKADVKTLYEGLSDAMPNGLTMVEEENSGRLLVIASDGAVIATFTNKGPDRKAFRMGWSRYIPKDYGDTAFAALRAQKCRGS